MIEEVARSPNANDRKRLHTYLALLQPDKDAQRFSDHESRILFGRSPILDVIMYPIIPQAEQKQAGSGGDGKISIPSDWKLLLRDVFEKYCNFGDIENTEWMTSSKWIQLLADGKIVLSLFFFYDTSSPTTSVVTNY